MSTIIFDLDDTLILEKSSDERILKEVCHSTSVLDNEQAVHLNQAIIENSKEFWPSFLKMANRKVTEVSWAEALWGPFENGDGGQLGFTYKMISEFRELAWSKSLTQVGQNKEGLSNWLSREYVVKRNDCQVKFPKVDMLLSKLVDLGVKLVILTNGAVCVQNAKIDKSDLRKYFDRVYISGEYPWAKPSSEIFQAVLKDLNISPDEALMVGNSLESDIKGALSVNISTVWLDLEKSIKELDYSTKQIIRIHQIDELLDIVK